MDFPPYPAGFDAVDKLVVNAYVSHLGVPRDVVLSNFLETGPGFEFDSLIGVELAGVIEATTGTEIPDVALDRQWVYRSLKTFADLVRRYVSATQLDMKASHEEA